jgi:hypothetical protein
MVLNVHMDLNFSAGLILYPRILIALTGWDKTAAFFGPVLVLEHLIKHPKPGLPEIPSNPVALIIKADFFLPLVTKAATSTTKSLKTQGKYAVVLPSTER